MLGEYGILINLDGLIMELDRYGNVIVNFLRTPNGQTAAVVLMAVCLLLFRRSR